MQVLCCYRANIKGYYVDIWNEKWGEELDMGGTSFNKYLNGEPDKLCVYGKWEPGQTSDKDHMWETDDCYIDGKYLTLCQELLCKCIDVAQK